MTATLGIDIGGTKTLVGIYDGARVLEWAEAPTAPGLDVERWCDTACQLAGQLTTPYTNAGAAVTGIIDADGCWSALNIATLNVPEGFPLRDALVRRLGCAVHCVNDAQAAAWGEYCHGAGRGQDLFFLTLSTGIGGGAVIDGRLLTGRSGLAGSAGNQRAGLGADSTPLENRMAGRWIAECAARAGHPSDARGVFAAARAGEAWARQLRETVVDAAATMLLNIQLMFDPAVIVLGGGIGLSDGFATDIDRRLSEQPARLRPTIRLAELGRHAGAIGAADLARTRLPKPV